jgi:hypothetical protein
MKGKIQAFRQESFIPEHDALALLNLVCSQGETFWIEATYWKSTASSNAMHDKAAQDKDTRKE